VNHDPPAAGPGPRPSPTPSLYERLGPERLRALVEAFYPRVARDPRLAPLFPADLRPVMEKQELFLTGFLGGPPRYVERFGHPRLRMRHAPFEITPERARAWLECMHEAAVEAGLEPALRIELMDGLARTAAAMINSPGR
jgi:hemoglobin